MRRVLITEFMDEAAVETLQAGFDVDYSPGLVDARDAMLDRMRDVDALVVRNRTRVDAEVLSVAPRLKVVGRLGVGLDNIDVAACSARNIEVIPATGANALSVAEYVVCTSMMLMRGAYLSSAAVASGSWPRTALSNGREVNGKTLGLIGYGGIGQLCARLAQSLGMHVIAHDPMMDDTLPVWRETRVRPGSLDHVFRQADIVSLHVPLTAATRGLVSAERIASMKHGAVLINTARGGIVDETALAAALRAGKLGGAALDVFNDEPLKATPALIDAPNLILTPHIAGVAQESNQRVSALIASRVIQALRDHA